MGLILQFSLPAYTSSDSTWLVPLTDRHDGLAEDYVWASGEGDVAVPRGGVGVSQPIVGAGSPQAPVFSAEAEALAAPQPNGTAPTALSVRGRFVHACLLRGMFKVAHRATQRFGLASTFPQSARLYKEGCLTRLVERKQARMLLL